MEKENKKSKSLFWFYFWITFAIVAFSAMGIVILYAIISLFGLLNTIALGISIAIGIFSLILFVYIFVVSPAQDLAAEARRDKLMEKYTDEDEIIKRKKESI